MSVMIIACLACLACLLLLLMPGVDSFFGGPNGYVQNNATSKFFSFDKWKLSMKTTLVEVTSFTSNGYQVMVPAITGATLTVSGPYNYGNMPFATGVGYVWNLGFSSSIFIQLFAMIETIEPDVDVKGRASISITAQSSGAFTAAVV